MKVNNIANIKNYETGCLNCSGIDGLQLDFMHLFLFAELIRLRVKH